MKIAGRAHPASRQEGRTHFRREVEYREKVNYFVRPVFACEAFSTFHLRKRVFLRIPPQGCFLFAPLLFSVFHPSRALRSGHWARILDYRRPHTARLRVSFSIFHSHFFSVFYPVCLSRDSCKCKEKNLLHSFAPRCTLV
jgi:hypothetical protein